MNKTLVTLGSLLFAGAAAAHPDHVSQGSSGLIHFLGDPFHITVTCLAIVLSAAVARRAAKTW